MSHNTYNFLFLQVYVEWKEPNTNGAPITEYRLEVSPSDVGDQFLSVYQGCSTNYEVKNLSPFTPYYFRVQACNSAGYGLYSPVAATFTPASSPGPCIAPKSHSTPTSITLNWAEPTNNGSPILNYNVEVSDRLYTTENDETEYTIENLTPETTYKIKIQAVNSVGVGNFSPALKASTLRLPPPPPKLECVGTGHNYLKLKWAEGKNQDYTQFSVEMESQRQREFYSVYKGTAFTCKITKLQEQTTYKFRINATNDAGVGDYSNTVEFTTNIAPPPGLKAPKALEIDQKGCILEWVPSKVTVPDPIVYMLQITRVKDQDFKQVFIKLIFLSVNTIPYTYPRLIFISLQVFKGSETKFHINTLDAGMEYSARVCCVRVASSGELPGPFSPVVSFTTLPPEPTPVPRRQSATNGSPAHSSKQRSLVQNMWTNIPPWKKIRDEYKNCLMALMLAVFGILLAALITIFLPLK